LSDLPPLEIRHPQESNNNGDGFLPYQRDPQLARPWALPGTPGLEHRVGGLEKADVTGEVCYDAANHGQMTEVRRRKVANVAAMVPPQTVDGPAQGDLLLVSWGGTYGAVRTAALEARRRGQSVAHCHLRYLNPFPANLGEILRSYRKVLIPELNTGQLRMILRGTYLVDAQGVNKVYGKPFLVTELLAAIDEALAG
jgi:2-oxoglutarate ferredoxin oxidoreductase subunit alpha